MYFIEILMFFVDTSFNCFNLAAKLVVRKMKRLILIPFLIWNSLVFGQATANFTASVTIIEPVSISTEANMNFASVSAISGGKIVLTPDGSRSSSGGVQLEESEGVSSAKFVINGQEGLTVAVTLPLESYQLTNGAQNIAIHSFTSNLPESFQLSKSSVSLRVGATVEVEEAQSLGVYTSVSPLSVMVNYN